MDKPVFRMSESGKCARALSAKPQTGEIRKGKEIGIKSVSNSFIWLECEKCGKPRWVTLRHGKPVAHLCKHCSDRLPRVLPIPRFKENHPRWKGGRLKTTEGYILVHIESSHSFYCMARKSLKGKDYVFEHRLVVAEHLGRPLFPHERVHHLNGIKDDNRIENLELIESIGAHITLHNKGYREGYNKGYQDGQAIHIQELIKEVKLLQWELKQLRERERV